MPGRPQAMRNAPFQPRAVVLVARLKVPLNWQLTTVSMPRVQVPLVAVPAIVPAQLAGVVPR